MIAPAYNHYMKKTLAMTALAVTLALASAASAQAQAIAAAKVETPKPSAQASDSMGTRLPDGLDADTLIGLLMPMGDPARVTMVAAKPWPRRADSYVVFVCHTNMIVRPRTSPDCSADPVRGEESIPPTTYVGLVEKASNGQLRLVAATGAMTAQVNWAESGLSQAPIAAESAMNGLVMPTRWDRFDLAAYKVRDDQYAFGLRVGWSDSYAGGGASFDALYLFAVDGDRLRVVLAQPMGYYSDIAGERNADGTRDHELEEERRVLQMSSRKTDGYYDVLIKGGSTPRTLKWSTRDAAYVLAN